MQFYNFRGCCYWQRFESQNRIKINVAVMITRENHGKGLVRTINGMYNSMYFLRTNFIPLYQGKC
jgi:hypothetical protein